MTEKYNKTCDIHSSQYDLFSRNYLGIALREGNFHVKEITPTHLGLEEHEMPSYSIAEPTRKCPHHEFQLRKCFSIHTRVVFRTVESSGNITTTGLVKQRKSTEKHRNLTKQRRMGYELNC